MVRPTSYFRVLAAALGACVVALSPARAQWTVTNLNSSAFGLSKVLAVTPTQQGGFARIVATGGTHPVLWGGSASTWTDLAPSLGLGIAQVNGLSQTQQVGHLSLHASLWNGTPASYVDLHPAGAYASAATATDGDHQVGTVLFGPLTGSVRAYMWQGSSASGVSLHPAGALDSELSSIAGSQQGGWIKDGLPASYEFHAGLWSGTAASFVDLHPAPEFLDSRVFGISPGHQVGYTNRTQPGPGRGHHAAMWLGTAASWIDLHPSVAGLSELWATCGSAQAGYANVIGQGVSAGVWFGTPESFVNLGALLPPGAYSESVATSIAELNGVYHVGGYAVVTDSNITHGFLWTGIPAPGSGVVLALAALLPRRCRRSQR